MDTSELLTLASEFPSLEPDSLQRQIDWFDDRCCDLVLHSGNGLQIFDHNCAAVSEKQTIHKLTNFYLVSSHFAVSASAGQVEEIATLHVAATGPFYSDEMSRCIKNKLAERWSNTPFEESRQLTGWRLTLRGEVLKSAFHADPNAKAHTLETYIQGILDSDFEPSSATLLNCEFVKSSKLTLQSLGPTTSVTFGDPEATSTASLIPAGMLPEWDNESGSLRLGDRLCRAFAGQAKNVAAVLDAFQKKGWPSSIQDPLGARRNPKKLRDCCTQLNKQLLLLNFHTDRTGRTIHWRHLEGDEK